MDEFSDPRGDAIRAAYESVDVPPAPDGFIGRVMAKVAVTPQEVSPFARRSPMRAAFDRTGRKIGDQLVWVAGVDRAHAVALAERTRYAALGWSIVFSALLAFAAMVVTVDMVLSPHLGLTLAVAATYAATVFTFDRFLVATVPDPSRLRRIKSYLPRVALSVLIGIVIAEPLVLKVFEPEVTAQLAIEQRAEEERVAQRVRTDSPFATRRTELDTELRRQQIESANADARVARAVAAYEREVNGTVNGRPGNGPLTRWLSEEVVRAQRERDRVERSVASETARLRDEIRRADAAIALEVARQRRTVAADDGLLARIHALRTVTDRHSSLAAYRWLLVAMLLLLDLLPVLFRMFLPLSRYDYELRVEAALAEWAARDRAKLAAELATQHARATMASAELLAEAELTVKAAALDAWYSTRLEQIAKGTYDVDLTPPFAAPAGA